MRIKVEASGVSEWACRISYRSRLLTRATQLDGMRRRETESESERRERKELVEKRHTWDRETLTKLCRTIILL